MEYSELALSEFQLTVADFHDSKSGVKPSMPSSALVYPFISLRPKPKPRRR